MGFANDMVRFFRLWLAAGVGVLTTVGCAGNLVEQRAGEFQFVPRTITGEPFLHQLFLNQRDGGTLHVYIEGDGRPWHTPRRISRDPTPENPLMLRLMSLDGAPAVYLGRPCYYQLADPQCSPLWWTDRRYSQEVVDSLNRVLDQLVSGYAGIALFGHSGGGTLAMLLAARREDVTMVVTLAGNLDTSAWTEFHGHSPLSGSLNPRTLPPLNDKIRQLHLIGAEDRIVTVDMLSGALAPQPGPGLRILPDMDHACCWARIWPGVLAEISDPPPSRAASGARDRRTGKIGRRQHREAAKLGYTAIR